MAFDMSSFAFKKGNTTTYICKKKKKVIYYLVQHDKKVLRFK